MMLSRKSSRQFNYGSHRISMRIKFLSYLIGTIAILATIEIILIRSSSTSSDHVAEVSPKTPIKTEQTVNITQNDTQEHDLWRIKGQMSRIWPDSSIMRVELLASSVHGGLHQLARHRRNSVPEALPADLANLLAQSSTSNEDSISTNLGYNQGTGIASLPIIQSDAIKDPNIAPDPTNGGSKSMSTEQTDGISADALQKARFILAALRSFGSGNQLVSQNDLLVSPAASNLVRQARESNAGYGPSQDDEVDSKGHNSNQDSEEYRDNDITKVQPIGRSKAPYGYEPELDQRQEVGPASRDGISYDPSSSNNYEGEPMGRHEGEDSGSSRVDSNEISPNKDVIYNDDKEPIRVVGDEQQAVDPPKEAPESNNIAMPLRLDESRNRDQPSRPQQLNTRSSQRNSPIVDESDGIPSQIPGSFESLMEASDHEDQADQRDDTRVGQHSQPVVNRKPKALASSLDDDVSLDDDEDEADEPRQVAPVSPNRMSSAVQQQSSPQFDSDTDLKTAAGYHYGKKKKKKVIVIKKKKKKKVKKYKMKKKEKHYHHHSEHHGGYGHGGHGHGHGHGGHDHGHYYMYAKVPKKKSWEFGFKRGNKKHWIERHEKGHKNKFKTKVKWYDKKSKGKGIHIWDYNHHDKKHHYG